MDNNDRFEFFDTWKTPKKLLLIVETSSLKEAELIYEEKTNMEIGSFIEIIKNKITKK